MTITEYRAAIGQFYNFIPYKIAKSVQNLAEIFVILVYVMNVTFCNMCIMGLSLHVSVLPKCVIALLLLMAGIHPNPEPENKPLTICHVNIQSLYMRSVKSDPHYKINYKISILCKHHQFDIIVISESWLSNDITN
jgi:hypothetical protein